MQLSQEILSDIVVFQKYAKYEPEIKRRETWEELCIRNMAMHIKKYPQLKDEIKRVYKEFVITKKVLPSMRSMQFAGRPIELSNNRMFNCAYVAADNPAAFWETMFLLLGGSGVGYSVQRHHVSQLPLVKGPTEKPRRFLVGDSIEGWADAVKVLVRSYFEGKSDPVFDYRDIRPKGARLITSGGKAPGPDPLRICIDHIRAVLNNAVGRFLTTIEVHDIMCHIADAVLSGGIRRAALIALFSPDDYDMLSAKSGNWWELNPQRGRANNSVVLDRNSTSAETFFKVWGRVKASGSGEPGFFWTSDINLGTNPCCFVSETPVVTTNGILSISEIVEKLANGDAVSVITFNEETRQEEIKKVVAGQLTKKDADVITLVIEKDNGDEVKLICTLDHKFLTKNRGWVEAKDLTEHDDIIEQN